MTPDWTWKTRGNLESVTKYINAGSGSASLRDISIRKFLANTFNLTPDVMETLPLHLARRLWLEIKRRAWGRGASEAGAFSRLRILVCKFQYYITGKIFAYFETFPALELVLLDQCRVSREFRNHAKQHGWHALRGSKFRGVSFAEESPAWKEIYKGLSNEGALFDIDSMQKPSENDEDTQPVLEVSLYSTASHRHGLSKILEPDDMWHFRRKARSRESESSATLCPQKRVLIEDSVASSCTSKRPALRSSRQRTMKNLLAEFQV
ncbi:MAG: hypothetical protein Q9178_001063 [Gyalolechia marmorata]